MFQPDSNKAKVVAGLCFLCFLLWLPAHGQEPFVDGFEDGSADGWTAYLGTMSISTAQAHSGTYSLRVLHPDDDNSGVVVREGFAANQGIFEAWFYVDNCYECNGMVAFQALDENNHYAATGMPYDLDGQSTIMLTRAVGGVVESLAVVHAPNLLYTQDWFRIRVYRGADGLINVYTTVQGVETLQISVYDDVITETWPLVFGGWGGVYVDDAAYSRSCCQGRTGDANGLGGDEPSIGDIAVLIDAKFISGTCDNLIPCLAEADVNQSGGADPTCDDITIGDISILIDYLFISQNQALLLQCL
jgi:hypothetical protein